MPTFLEEELMWRQSRLRCGTFGRAKGL